MEKRSHMVTIGVFAHVDAGKTSFVEAILYQSGQVEKLGRVDHGDSFLDSFSLEKKRGITIFSKLARCSIKGSEMIFIDTPGHLDFQEEAKRSMAIIDYAIFIFSATEKIHPESLFLWKEIEKRKIPSLIFVNKMDLLHPSKESWMKEFKVNIFKACVDMSLEKVTLEEEIALVSEESLKSYLEKGYLDQKEFACLFQKRALCPVFFGSCLKVEGIEEVLDFIGKYFTERDFSHLPPYFIYKIRYDDQEKITDLRLYQTSIKVKDKIADEKVHEIRRYSSTFYESVKEAFPGDLISLVGPKDLSLSKSSIGKDKPFFTYLLVRKDGGSQKALFEQVLKYAETLPELAPRLSSDQEGVYVSLSGDLQYDLLKESLFDSGFLVDFIQGKVAYKESILGKVRGFGHFEPLGHYAEVELIVEGSKNSEGISFNSQVPFEDLDEIYQKQIESQLVSAFIPGILTGSPLTHLHCTLIGGKSSLYHTNGGDFIEATNRALRSALMRADNILLEPHLSFSILVDYKESGKIVQELSSYSCSFELENTLEKAKIIGQGPISILEGYFSKLYTRLGPSFSLQKSMASYGKAYQAEEIIAKRAYKPLEDVNFSPHSIFCKNGKSELIPYDFLDVYLSKEDKQKEEPLSYDEDLSLEEIFKSTFSRNRNEKKREKERWKDKEKKNRTIIQNESRKTYLLVDSYNIIFDWPMFEKIRMENLKFAREQFIDLMIDYQGYKKEEVILIFDAYKTKMQIETIEKKAGLTIVYTKEAQTADEYIAKACGKLEDHAFVKVASSDRLVQLIVWEKGAFVRSASKFYEEVMEIRKREWEAFKKKAPSSLKKKVLDEKDLWQEQEGGGDGED